MDDTLYIGLSGLRMVPDSFDLGGGVVLRKCYAHLMGPLMMAFKPAPPGKPHPAPWKAAHGGASFDITAELSVPIVNGEEHRNAVHLASTISFLIFIFIDPAVTMSVLSDRSFAEIPLLADNEANLIPLEVRRPYFPLYTQNGTGTIEALERIRQTWEITYEFVNKSAEFALGVEALSTAQYQQNSALILVSLWAALEALFSPSIAELRFRVSSLIAAYLEEPGSKRAALQKDVAKLYDKRSSAAHGVPKHNQDDVVSTLLLVRRIFVAIIEDRKIPIKEELEAKLFGAS